MKKDVVGIAHRRCDIPSGKYIFIPVFNAECSTVEGNGNTYDELLACATGLLDPAQNVTIEWDGAPVQGFALNSPFRVQSPPMTFTLPENNILGLPAGPSLFASDNYVVMMKPPKQGPHTVHVHGEAPINAKSKFVLDVTYDLVVIP